MYFNNCDDPIDRVIDNIGVKIQYLDLRTQKYIVWPHSTQRTLKNISHIIIIIIIILLCLKVFRHKYLKVWMNLNVKSSDGLNSRRGRDESIRQWRHRPVINIDGTVRLLASMNDVISARGRGLENGRTATLSYDSLSCFFFVNICIYNRIKLGNIIAWHFHIAGKVTTWLENSWIK